MARLEDSSRRGRSAARIGLAAICAAVLATPSASRATGEVAGTASFSYVGNRSSDGIDSDSFRQFYQLVFTRPLSDNLTYTLGLDYQDDIGETKVTVPGFGTTFTKLSNRYLYPRISASWKVGDLVLMGRYEYTLNWYFDPLADGMTRRDLATGAGSATWRPTQDLQLTLSGDTYSASDPAAFLDGWNWRVAAMADWRFLQKFRLHGEARVITSGNRELATLDEAVRLNWGPRLAAYYDDQIGSAVTLSFSYTVDYSHAKDTLRSGSGTGGVLVEWFPVAALNGITDVPLDTTQNPLTQNSALIDRNFIASAGPSLGPDGSSFWNLAADMGRVLEIEQFRVNVRDANGNLVPSGGLVTWSAFTSNDGQRWVQIPVDLETFEPQQSNYQIRFARTAARYFKVVNFGTNSLATYVTEIQVFSVETVQGELVRYTDTLLQIGTGSVSAKLADRLVLNWNGIANLTRGWVQTTIGDNRDFSNSLSLTAGPYGAFTTTASTVLTNSSTAGFGNQSTFAGSVLLQYNPIPRFDAGLTVGAFRDQVNDVISHTYALNLSGRLQFYDAMRFQVNGLLSKQTIDALTTDYVGGGAMAEIDILRDLRFTARASITQAVYTTGGELPPDAALIPRPQQYQTYYGELRYYPGAQLILQARVGWVDTTVGGSGLLQNYRVSWSPFLDGAIQINTNFEQDIDLLNGRSFQRATVWPHWQINAFASLDVNYNYTNTTRRDLPPSRLQSLFATFTLTY